jgi:carbonic anhydrase
MQKLSFNVLLTFLFNTSSLMAQSPVPVNKSEKNQVREIVRHVIESNDEFVKKLPPGYFTELIHGQKPIATMVTCADSRLHTHALDIHPDGDLFFGS